MTDDSSTYRSSTERQDEFVRLLSRESSKIFGFILTLAVSRDDADDIFQETSVVLWRRYDDFEPGTNFRAWACRIAYLQVLNFRRSNYRCRVLSEEAIHALAKDALTVMEEEDLRGEALSECLEKLSAKDRQLIEQRYFKHQTTQQIATRQSRSIYSVYRALSRIHELLQRCVRQSLASDSV